MKHFITFIADFENQNDEFGSLIRRILAMNPNPRWSYEQVKLFLERRITDRERVILNSMYVQWLEYRSEGQGLNKSKN